MGNRSSDWRNGVTCVAPFLFVDPTAHLTCPRRGGTRLLMSAQSLPGYRQSWTALPLWRPVIGAALLAVSLLVGCGPAVAVKTVADPKTNFRKYMTFAMMLPNKPVTSENTKVDPFVMQRLRQLVYLRLKKMGFTVVGKESADFLVAVGASTDERVEVYDSRIYGHDPFYGPPSASADVVSVQEGMVVIDLVDGSKQAVFWRGTGVRSTGYSVSDEELGIVVDAILDKYPAPLIPLEQQISPQQVQQKTSAPPPAPAEAAH